MSKTVLFQTIQFSVSTVSMSKIILFQTIQFSVSTVSMSKTVLFQTIQFSVSTASMSKTVLFQTIEFSMSTPFTCQHCFILVKHQYAFQIYLTHRQDPIRCLPLRARVDLRMMAMKGYSAFSKASALQDQIVGHHIQDTSLGGCLTPPQRCSRCILHPQPDWTKYHID